MYIYNVTVKVESHRVDEWLNWMLTSHIPEVMATGFFVENRVCRILDEHDMDGVTFAVQYQFRTFDDYEQYRDTCAPALQKDHADRFGNDFVAFRTLMEIVS